MSISRRDFVLAGSASLLSLNLARAIEEGTGNGKRVLVIGGGPAGLCAAFELDRAGCDVTVFEARSFPGGRIMTLREPFADGLYAEAGAAIFGAKVIEHYVTEFDLPTVASDFDGYFSAPFYIEGRLVEQLPDGRTEWPLELAESERGLTRLDLWRRYRFGPVYGMAGELEPGDFPYPALARYDDMTMAAFFREQGASASAIRLMSMGYLEQVGEGTDSYSALSAIVEAASFRQQGGTMGPFSLEGGNDRLPKAFADRLGEKVEYRSPVLAVKQDADGIELTVEAAGGRQQARGDYAICAAPFPVLRDMTFSPGLSDLRRRAIQELDITSVTRIFLQFSERFWEKAGRNPGAWTDLRIGGVYAVATPQNGNRGILESFTGGARARHFQTMSDDDAIRAALEDIQRIHPEAADYFETGTVVKWDVEPWQLGCQLYFKPGQMHAFFPHIAEPEGRLYFAGDHIGGVPGYTHSALLSAQKAAAEILARS